MNEPTVLRDKRNGSMLVAATLAQAMAEDEDILVFGEDVAALGGVFGATRGLARRFGDRVFDTPISETAFVGMAVGAAQSGLRPVVEIMFADFIGVCFDQLLNAVAKNHYMSGGEVTLPLVVRTAAGSIGSAAQHSQLLSGTLAHIAGLKVYLPGTPGDLQALLRHAIDSPDPVVVIEHKRLLKTRVDELPWNDVTPAGEPVVVPERIVPRVLVDGDDLAIVASGWMVQEAVAASRALAEEGVSAAVIDLRALVPLDRDALRACAAGFDRVLVVDEDYAAYGVCAEVIATLCEGGGPRPSAIRRHAPTVPQPASLVLEERVVPSRESIAREARALLAGEGGRA